jgi:hypothetical protein
MQAMSELDEMNCDELADVAAELALGVLTGRERAQAIAHLDRCDACRDSVRQLTDTGEALLGLLPPREPPAGFETRVLTQLGIADRRPERARTGTRRMLAVAAVALAVLASGLGGWGLRGAMSSPATGNPRTAASLYSAPLTTASHQSAGTVFLYDGNPWWLYMSVKAGSVNGTVICQLVGRDGNVTTIGSFRLTDGYGYWASPDRIDPDNVAGARVTTTNGTVLATASLRASAG